MKKFIIVNGLEFWVFTYPDGRWQYIYDDYEGNTAESPIFAPRVKPSVKHFSKWIVSTIQEERNV